MEILEVFMRGQKIQITFSPQIMQILKQISEETGNSIAAIVRTALIDYLKKTGNLDAKKD